MCEIATYSKQLVKDKQNTWWAQQQVIRPGPVSLPFTEHLLLGNGASGGGWPAPLQVAVSSFAPAESVPTQLRFPVGRMRLLGMVKKRPYGCTAMCM